MMNFKPTAGLPPKDGYHPIVPPPLPPDEKPGPGPMVPKPKPGPKR
ncbi:hypothetical protein LCGC14_1319230 [marine sediment metagenome]|uniref:Uncharacterized protein n=1 Tax=marine sediment metagenome TaxID=412755 RepID=A0A0F9KK01_9ZZZZ